MNYNYSWRTTVKEFYHDVHMHLDLYKNTGDIIKHIDEYQSYTIAVTNLPVLYDRAIKMYKEQKYIRFAIGLHPELIKEYPEQIPILFERLEQCRYIGEVGLDFRGIDPETKKLQIVTFEKLIKACHSYGNKILSIHSRNAATEVIDIIGANFNGKIILHWFSGNITELNRAIKNDYYFSINSDMLKSQKGRTIIKRIPLNRLLIESDAPFTKDSKNNYNLRFVEKIVNELSVLKELEIDTMYKLFKNNFRKLLE
jgi:TatD DNase family protein